MTLQVICPVLLQGIAKLLKLGKTNSLEQPGISNRALGRNRIQTVCWEGREKSAGNAKKWGE